jgi:hypothetical protein
MDPRLVETVARALWGAAVRKTPWDEAEPGWQEYYRSDARAALVAIDASGEWWVAPHRLTHEMSRAGNPRNGAHYIVGDPPVVWDAMRSAYLAASKLMKRRA